MTYKVTVTYALYVYYLMLLLHLKAGQCIQYGGGGGGCYSKKGSSNPSVKGCTDRDGQNDVIVRYFSQNYGVSVTKPGVTVHNTLVECFSLVFCL